MAVGFLLILGFAVWWMFCSFYNRLFHHPIGSNFAARRYFL